MSLGEQLKNRRQQAGMSQEKVAELIGVSRQAVTKWETDRSAPSTENLFKLAELFDTPVDLLLHSEEKTDTAAVGQATPRKQSPLKKNLLSALTVVGGYAVIYLIGRILWCDLSQNSVMGWLFTAKPVGKDHYLFGWLLSSHLFWYSAVLSLLPALCGKSKLAYTTLAGFALGLITGILFGPYPAGVPYGHGHYGWLIWGICYLLSFPVGIFIEHRAKPKPTT